MKTIIISVFSITFFLTTSCSKESLLDADIYPSLMAYNENFEDRDQLKETEIEPLSYLGESGTIIQLQKTSSFISSATNEYIVHYYRSYDFIGAQLAETQILDLINPQDNAVTLNFGVNSYVDSTAFFKVAYALGARDLTGWEVKEVQQIVIEDVIVN